MDTGRANSKEIELWNLFRNGDRTAYAYFIHSYSNSLFNYGYRIYADRDFVKDCVQEVFIELWNRRNSINETNSVKWYLFKSVRLRIFRDAPKWNRTTPLEEEYEFAVEFNIEHQLIIDLETQELSLRIKSVLNKLPGRQREIMYLRFYENLNFDEISAIMQINKQSVHNLLQKAYRNFRKDWSYLLAIYFLSLQ